MVAGFGVRGLFPQAPKNSAPAPPPAPEWLDPDGRRRRSILEKPALGQMPQNREREEERERTMRGRLPLSAFLVRKTGSGGGAGADYRGRLRTVGVLRVFCVLACFSLRSWR